MTNPMNDLTATPLTTRSTACNKKQPRSGAEKPNHPDIHQHVRHAHPHTNLRTLLASIAAALGLVACGSSSSLSSVEDKASSQPVHASHQAATNRSDLSAQANAAQTPASTTTTTAKETAMLTAIVTPVAQPTISLTEPRPVPVDQSRYAGRADAAQLADELARSLNLPVQWTRDVIAEARYREVVPRLIMPAANPGAKNWAAYRSRFVEPQRLRSGQRFWQANAADLRRAEELYGVPAHIIAGVIGVETLYGRDTGRFRVLDALTTLSLDFPKGRSDRSAFFRQELGEFLLMCREQGLEPSQVLGSFAGAIGWPQFMPSSIRKHGVDFDGDGHIDLINSPSDAIGSVANFLAAHGWQAQWPTHFPVRPPANGPQLDTLLAPDIRPTFTASQMRELGAQLPESAMNHPGPLAMVLLHNAGRAPTIIAGTRNFYALTRYNQSSYYALAVIELGQAISQGATRSNQ